MASGQTLVTFFPHDNQPGGIIGPAVAAQQDVRNGHPCIDFDTTTAETAVFSAIMPRNYINGNPVTVFIHSSMSSAVAGTVGWTVEFERSNGQDIDLDGFGPVLTMTVQTVPSVSGNVLIQSLSTDWLSIDSIQPGELFRLRVKRDVASDTAAGDAELLCVELKET